MERIHIKEPTATAKCAEVLEKGGVVVYPTDTLYGIGADATNPTTVQKIREIKGRDAKKPILVMVSGMEMLETYATVTPLARLLIEKFIPGPLTLVLTSKTDQLAGVAKEDGSVGFRIPDNNFCLELTRSFGKPITSTSVNRSGFEPSRTLPGMLADLGEGGDAIDLVVDAGTLPECDPSTIVDARGESLQILRAGALTLDGTEGAAS